ncbi:hypothetical protein KI688_011307 [Linnemannia hyalina]|uniref:Uncharacterized protein n=1 Tax=Linnemannia hyalina TaxID=64524 RepID=A0A9P8BTJ3_9FUNG|nr:hypothetical protein KI688_011307 [Linnemannia hyalina]
MRHNYRPNGEIVSCVDGYNTVSGRKHDVTRGLVTITTLIPIHAIINSDPEKAGVGAVTTEPHHTTIPTELFDRAQVQDVAKRVHGVWYSIDAACTPKK